VDRIRIEAELVGPLRAAEASRLAERRRLIEEGMPIRARRSVASLLIGWLSRLLGEHRPDGERSGGRRGKEAPAGSLSVSSAAQPQSGRSQPGTLGTVLVERRVRPPGGIGSGVRGR